MIARPERGPIRKFQSIASASKEDVVRAAEGNGAPEELVGLLGTLGRPSFESEDEVVAELEASPTSG